MRIPAKDDNPSSTVKGFVRRFFIWAGTVAAAFIAALLMHKKSGAGKGLFYCPGHKNDKNIGQDAIIKDIINNNADNSFKNENNTFNNIDYDSIIIGKQIEANACIEKKKMSDNIYNTSPSDVAAECESVGPTIARGVERFRQRCGKA